MSARANPPAFALLVSAALSILISIPAGAGPGPTAGFIEEWNGTSVATWVDGLETQLSNPGTGGITGPGDGFLLFSTSSPMRLGVFSLDNAYLGDWAAAGIRSVKVWLDDVGTDDPLEIHFVIGASHANLWQYNPGFDPPHGQWAQFVVDLTDSTRFTQFAGTGTFSEALHSVDRIHFRHDHPPFTQNPDLIQADVGMDHLELSDQVVPNRWTTWGRIKALYR